MCETQIQRNCGGYIYTAGQICKFAVINLQKFDVVEYNKSYS